jgi:DHA2 family multidrug resistance protein
MRNLGGAVGLATITTALNNRWDLHIARLHEAVTWSSQAALERLNALTYGLAPSLGSDAPAAALKTLSNGVRREALVMAFSDVFLILTAVFIVVTLLVPLARRPQAPPAGAGGGH